jgi:hypothetical protein
LRKNRLAAIAFRIMEPLQIGGDNVSRYA